MHGQHFLSCFAVATAIELHITSCIIRRVISPDCVPWAGEIGWKMIPYFKSQQVGVVDNLWLGVFTSLRDGNRPHRIVTANDVGHWDQKHPKVLIVGKKNAKNLIAMYSGPTQFKNNEKHEKTAKLLLFTVFLRGEKQKPLQIPWFLRVRWPKTL